MTANALHIDCVQCRCHGHNVTPPWNKLVCSRIRRWIVAKFSNFVRFCGLKSVKMYANCFSYRYRNFAPGTHWRLPFLDPWLRVKNKQWLVLFKKLQLNCEIIVTFVAVNMSQRAMRMYVFLKLTGTFVSLTASGACLCFYQT